MDNTTEIQGTLSETVERYAYLRNAVSAAREQLIKQLDGLSGAALSGRFISTEGVQRSHERFQGACKDLGLFIYEHPELIKESADE